MQICQDKCSGTFFVVYLKTKTKQNMKTKIYTVIISILITTGITLNAQYKTAVDSIRFSGMIFDKDSLTVLPYAKYALDEKVFTANDNGEFYLWAKQGDIIKFSYVGYKDTYIQVHDTLDDNNYIVGVFLSKDTIQLSEVIVIPRYRQLLLDAMYSPLKVDPAYQNALRNVRQAKNQALSSTGFDKPMTAEQNQDMVIRENTMRTVYKTQVPPDMIFGINTSTLIPYIVYLRNKRKAKIKEADVNDSLSEMEAEFLINIYHKQKEREKENKSKK